MIRDWLRRRKRAHPLALVTSLHSCEAEDRPQERRLVRIYDDRFRLAGCGAPPGTVVDRANRLVAGIESRRSAAGRTTADRGVGDDILLLEVVRHGLPARIRFELDARQTTYLAALLLAIHGVEPPDVGGEGLGGGLAGTPVDQ